MATEKPSSPLTTKSITRAAPREAPYFLVDAAPHRGLLVRIAPTGHKSFRYRLRSAGRMVTIGEFSETERPGFVTLAQARKIRDDLKKAHKAGRLDDAVREMEGDRDGVDPEAPGPGPAGGLTVRKSVEKFLEHLKRERRRPEQAERLFKVDLLDPDVRPAVADLPLRSFTKEHARDLVERVVKRDSPVMARHLHALIVQWLNFAVDRGDLDANPAARLRAKALGARKPRKRKRYLSEAEIPVFWRGLDALSPTIRGALRVLLLSGVRAGALLGATWDEVDLDGGLWTIPTSRLKLTLDREQDAEPFRVPLAPAAVAVLKELRALADAVGSRYVLASFAKDDAPISEKAINAALRKLQTGDEPALTLPGGRVRPHDMRRTLRDHCEKTLGFPEALCERLLGHVRGDQVETYAPSDDLARRRETLTAWAAYVTRLLSESGKVVPIRAEAVRS